MSRELLQQLADLLPADVWWGDSITPSMLVDILDKYAASRQEQPVPEDTIDAVSKAMRHAYQLGQLYWQQADSESWTENKKSTETANKFSQLVSRQAELEWLRKAGNALQSHNNALEKELASRQEQPDWTATVPDAQPEHRWDDDCDRSYIQGWNDCRKEMLSALAAAPSPEGEKK